MVIERVHQMSVGDFLDFAESSEDWYEYIDGELRQMTGETLDHFAIIASVSGGLLALLTDTHCKVVGSGMLIRTGVSRLVAPDVSVVCGEPQTEADTRILLNPIFVVEVTSPSSSVYDRVLKREYYWDVASIQAYLVVDQHSPLVELHTRSESGWRIDVFSNLADEVPLDALSCSLPMREIYRDIQLDT